MRTRPYFARGLALSSIAAMLACSSVTTVTGTDSIAITAQPPALPLPDLPPIPQPPPPPWVTLEGDTLVLLEVLGFDESGQLWPAHQTQIAELAAWLAAHAEVAVLSVEVQAAGESSRRKQDKRNKALAQRVVDALIAEGIEAERLRTTSTGTSEDGQVHVMLRVIEWAPIEDSPEGS
jgi:outer membrane protein OmpA-like peptidoglycan-associated protein